MAIEVEQECVLFMHCQTFATICYLWTIPLIYDIPNKYQEMSLDPTSLLQSKYTRQVGVLDHKPKKPFI